MAWQSSVFRRLLNAICSRKFQQSNRHLCLISIPGLFGFVHKISFTTTLYYDICFRLGPEFRSVAAVVSCYCFIFVAAAIVLGQGALFLLFVLLYSRRVASHSCETSREQRHRPPRICLHSVQYSIVLNGALILSTYWKSSQTTAG